MHDGLEHVAYSLVTRGEIATFPDTRDATHHPCKRIRVNYSNCTEYDCPCDIDSNNDCARSRCLVSESGQCLT